MWTYEKTVEGGTHAVSRVRVDPRPPVRELQPVRTTVRSCCAASPGPASAANVDELVKKDELGDALALSRRRTDGAREGGGEDRSASRVRPDARRRRAAHRQGDEHRLGREGPAVGVGNARVSQRPARAEHRRRGSDYELPEAAVAGAAIPRTRSPSSPTPMATASWTSKHVFADKLELVTGFVLYKNGVIASTSPDIWYLEDTNGDEVADKRTKLYTGLGTFDTHAVINNLRWGLDGWIYATHGYSVGDGHVSGRHEEFRPRRQRRRPLQAGRQRLRAVQQPRRQHLGPRHHLGRPGVLDAADERHGLLPHRAAGVGARQGTRCQARRRGRA